MAKCLRVRISATATIDFFFLLNLPLTIAKPTYMWLHVYNWLGFGLNTAHCNSQETRGIDSGLANIDASFRLDQEHNIRRGGLIPQTYCILIRNIIERKVEGSDLRCVMHGPPDHYQAPNIVFTPAQGLLRLWIYERSIAVGQWVFFYIYN